MRFDGIEKQALTPHFSVATLLDPRCKKVAFGLAQNANDAEASLVAETATLIRNVSNTGKYIIYKWKLNGILKLRPLKYYVK